MTSPASSAQAERILSFWHKVEFFAAPDLKDLEEEGSGAIHYSHDDIESNPVSLPWLDRQHLKCASRSHDPNKPYAFKLYLGIFCRSDIFRIARECYPEKAEGIGDAAERNDDEGLTCSMTARVNEYGRIDPESFEFSTAPWALGEVLEQRLDEMTMSAFEAATRLFHHRLKAIVTMADNAKHARGLPTMLTTFELIAMLKALGSWTSFNARPSGVPAIYIQAFEVWGDRAKAWLEAQSPFISAASLQELGGELREMLQSPISTPDVPQDTDEGHDGEEVDTSNEIAILNSFFIRDIERVMKTQQSTGLAPGSPLACYLQDGCDKHPDLLLPEGRSLLMTMLSPERMPKGRWPSEDAHSMSLMQQFAINSIDAELEDIGLYSVNGPPGTGKTTMLRDLVANNMVKRAAILASLPSAGAAFGTAIQTSIRGRQTTINPLIPALTGFEMVVASSNNAAVENVTQELPQLKALGEKYQSLEYLKPVAQKLAASHEEKQGKLHVRTLAPKKDCWGLMAAALGNSRNRKRFGERVFIKKVDESCVAQGEASCYSTLIPALNMLAKGRNPKRDFMVAQRAFKEAEQTVQAIQDDLVRLQELRRLAEKVERARHQADVHDRLSARIALWRDKQRPKHLPLWALVARLKKRAILKRIDARVTLAGQQAVVSRQHLDSLKRRLDAKQRSCAALIEKYRDVLLPDESLDMETPDIQRTSFGHGEVLNQARSELTKRAFALHEAWLVAAYSENKDLRFTINALMTAVKGSVEDPKVAKALWQMLFMIVPVISSTFASVMRQFQDFGEGEVGWLFIDEAGQATPQQAVGALWRAKRAVVVGDPLQIEPVFTVPVPLVEALAETKLGKNWLGWSPTAVSVQMLADRVNPYGTRQIADELWVGSPLRVHRRCDEPMFSIANRIAYNDKMLHGNPDLAPGPNGSVWIDIDGTVDGRHFVPRQAEAVYEILMRHMLHDPEKLPEFYIISPFKQVAGKLREYLEERLTAPCFKHKNELRQWLKYHVGTVHTFQGKEESNVILVLGLSKDKPGAADWASDTPNLLNVALTRAKKRVYIVGSQEIWAGKPYFSEAKAQLLFSESKRTARWGQTNNSQPSTIWM